MKGPLAILIIAAFLLLSYLTYSAIRASAGIENEHIAELMLVYGNGSAGYVNVYVASSTAEQERGLMYQRSMGSCGGLGDCYGMLFVFPNASDECFWMKNTEMPLKQFWITSNLITAQVNGTPYSTKTYCNTGGWVLEAPANSTLGLGNGVYLEKALK